MYYYFMMRYPVVGFVALTLLTIIAGLCIPLTAHAASSNIAYFAVYCPQGGGLSTTHAQDNVLTCHQGGTPPLFEASVSSLTTNPDGANFVTIVEADCYPDTSQVPQAPATPTGRIDCGTSPDATLTLGSTFSATTPTASAASTLPPPPPSSASCNSSGCDLITEYLQPTINLLSGVVGIIVVISLILAGIEYSTSEGDPQKSAKAKRRITNTLFALIAFFFLYAFLQFLVPGGIF